MSRRPALAFEVDSVTMARYSCMVAGNYRTSFEITGMVFGASVVKLQKQTGIEAAIVIIATFTPHSRRCKSCVFNPWVGEIPWRRKWQPAPVFSPGQLHGQRILVDYSPWDHKETRLSD